MLTWAQQALLREVGVLVGLPTCLWGFLLLVDERTVTAGLLN